MERLGTIGDEVNVKNGFARNFLIPQGKALPATKNNLAEVEERRAELEKQAAELLSAAEARADKLAEATITVGAKSGDEGKLFGSVGTANIADAISEQTGVAVEKAEVKLPLGARRQTGEYEIDLSLHADVTVTIKLTVVPQE
ncbi:MAG TPA: 50S ribosomal protein L9 [Alcanivorax sp.]|nr:50S ribosomal protein L9 [Alcanivorax sp.]